MSDVPVSDRENAHQEGRHAGMSPENNTDARNEAGASLGSWRAAAGDRAGRFEGSPYGSPVSFFVVDAAPGDGPAPHRHPYAETFIVLGGRGRFEVGGHPIEVETGDVLVAPPETAHAFRALGTERLRLVAIHAAARMDTTWLAPGQHPEEPAPPSGRR